MARCSKPPPWSWCLLAPVLGSLLASEVAASDSVVAAAAAPEPDARNALDNTDILPPPAGSASASTTSTVQAASSAAPAQQTPTLMPTPTMAPTPALASTQAQQPPQTRQGAGEATTQAVPSAWSPLCDLPAQGSLALGDQVSLCVFLGASPPQRMVFNAKVEQYAEFVLRGSQKKAAEQGGDTYTWVSGAQKGAAMPLDCADESDVERRGQFASCPQLYATKSNAVHLQSLVVNLREGVISSFAWDNNCRGCGPASCVRGSKSIGESGAPSDKKFLIGTCATDLQAEGCKADGGSGCDLKILVTWAGTDKNGRPARSAGIRVSKFTGYTMRSVYEKGKKNFNDIVK